MKNRLESTLQTTIIFLVVAGVLALALSGVFGRAANWFSGSLIDAQTWISARFLAIQDFLTVPRDVLTLRQENQALQAEVNDLRIQVDQLQQQVTETEILAALVDFSRANPESSYKAASVIGRDPSPFLRYVIINAGSNDGVLRGMPVVTSQGLVGRVSAVIADAARVQLITDAASAVNVRIEDTNTDAVLVGSVSGDLELDLVSQDANVQPGYLVLTSGLGGGYPPDLLVGQVTTVRKRDYDLFQQASVQPVVDFSKLQIVLVITDFRPIDITPLLPGTTAP